MISFLLDYYKRIISYTVLQIIPTNMWWGVKCYVAIEELSSNINIKFI